MNRKDWLQSWLKLSNLIAFGIFVVTAIEYGEGQKSLVIPENWHGSNQGYKTNAN